MTVFLLLVLATLLLPAVLIGAAWGALHYVGRELDKDLRRPAMRSWDD